MLVIGPRDLAEDKVSVRVHGQGNLGAKPRAEVVAGILAANQRAAGVMGGRGDAGLAGRHGA